MEILKLTIQCYIIGLILIIYQHYAIKKLYNKMTKLHNGTTKLHNEILKFLQKNYANDIGDAM